MILYGPDGKPLSSASSKVSHRAMDVFMAGAQRRLMEGFAFPRSKPLLVDSAGNYLCGQPPIGDTITVKRPRQFQETHNAKIPRKQTP